MYEVLTRKSINLFYSNSVALNIPNCLMACGRAVFVFSQKILIERNNGSLINKDLLIDVQVALECVQYGYGKVEEIFAESFLFHMTGATLHFDHLSVSDNSVIGRYHTGFSLVDFSQT